MPRDDGGPVRALFLVFLCLGILMFLGKEETSDYKLLDMVHEHMSAAADILDQRHASDRAAPATTSISDQRDAVRANLDVLEQDVPEADVTLMKVQIDAPQEKPKKATTIIPREPLEPKPTLPVIADAIPQATNVQSQHTGSSHIFLPPLSTNTAVKTSTGAATTASTALKSTNITIPTMTTIIDRNFKSPEWIYGSGVKLKVEPAFGTHRPHADAIFAFAKDYPLPTLVLFVGSLLQTGYVGDIVLGISPDLPEDVEEYITYHAQHSHLVAYVVQLECRDFPHARIRCTVENMFWNDGAYLADSRPPREKAQLRFEFYWAWSLQYSADSRIFLLDARDVYFQRNPFPLLETNINTTLHVFEEWEGKPINKERSNSLWIRAARGKEWLEQIGDRNVVCSGTTVGGKPAIEMYTRALVAQWDDTLCTIYGCDQGHHNFLVHGHFLEGAPNITQVVIHPQGTSVANTVGTLASQSSVSLRMRGYVDNRTHEVLNKDGSPSPVIHQFDRDEEMKGFIFGGRTRVLLLQWNKTITESQQHVANLQR
jgi:hypothetical protein